MPAKNATRVAKPATKQSVAVEETLAAVEESTEKKQLTDTQMDYLKRRSVNAIMDSLIEAHKGIKHVTIAAYKTYESKAFDKNKLTAEVFKIIYDDGKLNPVNTTDLWEMFKIRPKIELTNASSIRDVKLVSDVKTSKDLEKLHSSFIRIDIPAERIPYSFVDKKTGEKKSGHRYQYKITNIYTGKLQEQMKNWLQRFDEITKDKDLWKKYPWEDESEKIKAIEVMDLDDLIDDE